MEVVTVFVQGSSNSSQDFIVTDIYALNILP